METSNEPLHTAGVTAQNAAPQAVNISPEASSSAWRKPVLIGCLLVFLCIIAFLLYAYIAGIPSALLGPQGVSAERRAYMDVSAAQTQASLAYAAEEFAALQSTATTSRGKSEYGIAEAGALMPYDPQSAYQLLRTIADDPSNPSFFRGYAVEMMADAYQLAYPTADFAQSHPFAEQPYSSFLTASSSATTTPKEVRLAIFRLYNYSRMLTKATSTLPISNYRVAAAYLRPILVASSTLSAQDTSAYLAKARNAYKEGNTGLAAFVKSVPPGIAGYAYWMQADVLGELALAQASSTQRALAEAKFQHAIDFLGGTTGRRSTEQRMWAEFSYALYLNRAYQAGRADQIQALLSDIALKAGASGPALYNLPSYLKNLAPTIGQNTEDGYANQIRQIAHMSPAFSSYLAALGWTV